MESSETQVTRQYVAQVEEVHSGDDLVLMVDLGVDSLFKRVRARLHGVDTPDAYKLDSDTPAGQVRDHVRDMVRGKQCMIELHANRRGGWIVTLFVKESGQLTNVNDALRQAGYIFQG